MNILFSISRVLLAGALGLGGCHAFDPALLNPVAATLPTRLPTLAPETQSQRLILTLDPVAVPTDVRTLFEREVREVLTEPYGPPKGIAVLRTRRVSARAGLGYALVSGLTLGGLNLFGFPWARYQYVVDVQLDVLSSRRELLGSYRGQGQARATGSLYSATNYAQPDRVLYLQCVRQGLSQIVPQLQVDAPRLRTTLVP